VQLLWALKVHAYAVTIFGNTNGFSTFFEAFLMIQASKRVSFKNFRDVADVAIIHKMRQFSQFGYKQDMKINKFKHPSLFLATFC
jgi:hypothetical protein